MKFWLGSRWDGTDLVDSVITIPLIGLNPFPCGNPGEDAWPDFIAGFENRLVTPAVRSVLEDRTHGYNPVLFRGSAGTGKTHLAKGLSLAYKARHPRRRVIFTRASDFGREYGEAIATHGTDDFRDRHQKAALLVMEDVDALAERQEAQEELALLIDSRDRANARTVFSGSAFSGSATQAAFLPRLQSRLDGGLTILLVAPGLAARLVLVRRLAALRHLNLTESAARLLAEGLAGTVPQLCMDLIRLEGLAASGGGAIDSDIVKRLLAARGTLHQARLADIAAATARLVALKPADLRSASRRQAVVTARGVAMYLARQMTSNSLEQIGKYFGGRDHSTVMYGCRKIERLLQHDPAIRRMVRQINETLMTPQTSTEG